MPGDDPTLNDSAEETADLRRRLAEAERRADELQARLDASEQAHGATGSLLATVLDNMGNGLVVYDADDRLVVCNERFAEMYGFAEADLRPGTTRQQMIKSGTGRTWPENPSPAAEFFGGSRDGEISLPTGSVYQRIMIPTPDGGCVITHTDVTDRKRAENELRKQREVLMDVFDNVAQGIAAYDENAQVITWNKKYQEYLILSDEQIYPGCPVWDLVMLHAVRGTYGGGTREELEQQVQVRIDRLMSGDMVRFDYVNAKGIEMEAVSAPRPQGGFVVTYADITERKSVEAEMIRARDEAEAANRAKSSFLAAMSHEIRTPMNGVLGLIEVLQHSELSDDQRVLAETVNESARALLRIIDDILDFSKIEAGRMELESVPLPLRRTIESVLDTIAAAAEEKGLDLTLEIDAGLPDAVVGDPVRLRQVLLNLVGNGVKFTAKGGVSVRLRADPPRDGDARTIIGFEVTDTGIGLSEAQQADLFQPFSQAESTTTRRFGGTGLGLSICRRLVELMGGEIGVISEAGAGATFRFTMPFDVIRQAATAATTVVDLSGVPVVIVSDRAALTAMLSRELDARGAHTARATDAMGLSAMLKTLSENAVLLVDDRMPDSEVGGLRPSLEGRRVILIRGAGSSPLSTAAAAFDSTLTRPVHRGALLRAVAAAAHRQLAEQSAPAPSDADSATDDHPPRILVAEDTPINRFVVERQLDGLGYTADYAADGREAFALWQANEYDVILADCHMPTIDGFELTRMIRDAEAKSGGRRTPIVALTANTMAGEAEKCMAAGMDDFLSKPVTIKQMGETLGRWIATARG